MKIINNKSVKAIEFGSFTNKWYFEIRKTGYCVAVEIKGFGLHFRWYIGKHFYFLRNADDISKVLFHS